MKPYNFVEIVCDFAEGLALVIVLIAIVYYPLKWSGVL